MTLKAGICIQDVSPQKPTFLVGYPHIERMSTGIHDPLLVSALYLQNQTTDIMMIAIDILQINPQTAKELRKTISQRTDIPESHIFIGCTHTHSGPVTMEMIAWQNDPVVPEPDPDYMSFFKNSVIDSAITATLDLRPVEMAWTIAKAKEVGGNRISPDGIADTEIGILVIRESSNKKIIALSTIYSMHPTVLHEDSTLVSADFPGYAREYLRKAFGKELAVMYHTGTSGDQSPRHSVKAQTFDEAKRLGYLLGESILESVIQITDFDQDAILDGKTASVELPTRIMPSVKDAEELLRQRIAEYEHLKDINANRGDIRTAECAVFGAEETLTLSKCQDNGKLSQRISEYIPAEVQVLKIGNCCLAGLPGEIFVEYGLQIKNLAYCKTFVVSLVNGDLQGYIVTDEFKESGGYEANNSLFEPESGKIMVNAILKIIGDLL
jgi:neutral ceramidase